MKRRLLKWFLIGAVAFWFLGVVFFVSHGAPLAWALFWPAWLAMALTGWFVIQ